MARRSTEHTRRISNKEISVVIVNGHKNVWIFTYLIIFFEYFSILLSMYRLTYRMWTTEQLCHKTEGK